MNDMTSQAPVPSTVEPAGPESGGGATHAPPPLRRHTIKHHNKTKEPHNG